METHDRLTVSVQFTANKGLTDKQWQKIHAEMAQRIEDMIQESEKLTSQIGHVSLGSSWEGHDKEISS